MNEITQNDESALTDEALMLAYAAGDASAFDILYQRNRVAIYRFFIRQNISQSIAEELCHDAWLKVINARENYQVSALFRTYLFTIARHVFIDFQQKKSTQNEQTSYVEDNVQDNEKVEDVKNSYSDKINVNKQLKKILYEHINQLPFEQKQVFILKQESGFSIDQIAEITEQNKEKVKSRWRYAIQKLREGLGGYVN